MNIGTPGAAYGPGFQRPGPVLNKAGQGLIRRAIQSGQAQQMPMMTDRNGGLRRMPPSARRINAPATAATIHGVMMGELQRRLAAAKATRMGTQATQAHQAFQAAAMGAEPDQTGMNVGAVAAGAQPVQNSMYDVGGQQVDPRFPGGIFTEQAGTADDMATLLARARLAGYTR